MSQVSYGTNDAHKKGGSPAAMAERPTDLRAEPRQTGDFPAHGGGGGPAGPGGYAPRPKRVKRDDVIFFANQLAVMVDTGVPLTEALDAILSQTQHTGMKFVIEDLSARVKGGEEFSSALEQHPRVFSRLFVSLMRASEVSGTMGRMLLRVTEYMKSERDIRKQIKGAMVYPICMLSFCMVVVLAILVFVLPRFEKIYAGKGAALPAPTRVLMATSNVLVSYWYAVILALVAAGVAIYWYVRTEDGRRLLDKLRISLPIIGGMYRKACLARSMRTMATMVTSGVNMLDGLEITANVAGNRHYRQVWMGLIEEVREGSTLAEHLGASPLIPNTLAQMVYSGERTGKLALVMNRVAEFCEDDLRTSVRSVTSLIEPIMIIVMGLVIGGIAMALLLPVFNISRIVAH